MNNINIINDSLYNKCEDVRKKVLRRFCAFDGIGADLTNCESYDEALEAAGLDYTAKKEKLFLENGTEIEGNFAVMKSDDPTKFLGIVGNQYTCVANRDAFSVAEELYKEGYMRYETGGPVLAARDKVDYSQAVLILRGDDFDVAGEPFNQFTILRNSFDGSTGVNFQVICQRVWCQNMATRYLGGKKNQLRINIQHSRTAEERISRANTLVVKRNQEIALIQKEAEAFIGTKFTRAQFEQTIVPTILKEMKLVENDKERQRGHEHVEKVVSQIISAYDAEDVQNWNGTAYKVILALQDFETHMTPMKDTSNKSVYLNRVSKGMLLTTAAAQVIASLNSFDMRKFQN